MGYTDQISKLEYLKLILLDIALLLTAYLIPTISHATSFPLYVFEPMRIILFTCVCLSAFRSNVYIMALTLPLFSFALVGHPMGVKSVIMAIELLFNVVILYKLKDIGLSAFSACFVSIVISKALYYIIKYGAISIGLLQISLVDTPMLMQLAVALLISIVFLVVNRK